MRVKGDMMPTRHNSGKIHNVFKDLENDLEYQLEELKIWLLEEIIAIMEEKRISRSELSRRLGVSRAYITKLFRANINLTCKSLLQIVNALDAKISIRIHPEETIIRWFEVYEQKKSKAEISELYKDKNFEFVEPSVTLKEPEYEYRTATA